MFIVVESYLNGLCVDNEVYSFSNIEEAHLFCKTKGESQKNAEVDFGASIVSEIDYESKAFDLAVYDVPGFYFLEYYEGWQMKWETHEVQPYCSSDPRLTP